MRRSTSRVPFALVFFVVAVFVEMEIAGIHSDWVPGSGEAEGGELVWDGLPARRVLRRFTLCPGAKVPVNLQRWYLRGNVGPDGVDAGPEFRLIDGARLRIDVSYAGYGRWDDAGPGNKFLLNVSLIPAGTEEEFLVFLAEPVNGGDYAPTALVECVVDKDVVRIAVGDRVFRVELPGEIGSIRWNHGTDSPVGLEFGTPGWDEFPV